MKTITAQEYYDRLYTAAHDGTFPSYRRENNHSGLLCLYRGPDNTRCAVGILIPDDKYQPEFDSKNLTCDQLPGDACEHVEGVASLWPVQSIHDDEAEKHLHSGQWDARSFIKRINTLSMFASVQKKEPA